MKEIEKIYNNLDRLIDNYADFDFKCETNAKAEQKINALARSQSPDKGMILDVLDAVNDAEADSERQGFIYGFSYAMKLVSQCKEVV